MLKKIIPSGECLKDPKGANKNAREIGDAIEAQACYFLEQKGLKLIQQNFLCKCGEIDLIMRDKNYFVFIEVRFRKSNSHGGALDSVTLSKQKKIIRAAQYYLLCNKLLDRVPCRFDVVSVTTKATHSMEKSIEWVRNAFTL